MMMKRHLGLVLRIVIAAAGVAYILYTLNWSTRIVLPDGTDIAVRHIDMLWVTPAQPIDPSYGLYTKDEWVRRSDLESDEAGKPHLEPSFLLVFKESEHIYFIGGLFVFAPVFLIISARWTLLMRARMIGTGFGRAFRLTMAGQFFNLCMPGTTGGDVMKAYYAARGSHKRADAVVSVAVDRVCGIVGLIMLVAIAGLFNLDNALIRHITITMWLVLAGVVVVSALYTSRALRACLGIGGLVRRLPGAGMLQRMDALVTAYRNHIPSLLTAIAISVLSHVFVVMSMSAAGYAIGVDQPLLYLLGTVPVVLILWSLPISGPLGLGPLDYVAVQLIVGSSQTTAQQAMLMFVVFRFYAVIMGLCGSSALLGSGAPSASVPADHEPSSAEKPA